MTRPRQRGDCVDGPRPCPWIGCRHHLGAEVSKAGTLKLREVTETCSLDVADRGGATLEQIGVILGVTREMVRQVEGKAMRLFIKQLARLEAVTGETGE